MSYDIMYVTEVSRFKDPTIPTKFHEVPVKPPSGFAYIYEWDPDDPLAHKKQLDWRADGYRFRQNGSVKFSTPDGFDCVKKFFKLQIGKYDFTTVFTKAAIFCSQYPNKCLVSYSGDASVVVELPHFKSKRKAKLSQPLYRTKPSVIHEIKTAACNESKHPHEIYDDFDRKARMASTDPLTYATSGPRDVKQVRNGKERAMKEQMISLDDLYRAYQLGYLETAFISDFILLPGAVILMHNKAIMSIFRSLLGRKDLPPMYLCYDTTYELGDFYVSVLTFRLTEFEETPIIPLMYMIHHRKWEFVHEFFFWRLTMMAPELLDLQKAERILIATDGEEAIVNAIGRFLPTIKHFQCWVHKYQNIKRFLRSHGITYKPQIKEFKYDFMELLEQPSEQEYNNLLLKKIIKWSQISKEFCDYFHTNVHPIINKLGSWVLRPYDIKLMTTNQAESYNAILKLTKIHKKKSVDEMIYAFLLDSEKYESKIAKGRYRIGGLYSLREHLRVLYDINDPAAKLPQPTDEDDLKSRVKKIQAEENKEPPVFESAEMVPKIANRYIAEKRIVLVPEMQSFLIKGICDRKEFLVRLFKDGMKSISCSCLSSSCSHILAAMKSIDYRAEIKKKPNLSRLVKMSRSRTDKSGGHKKERPNDARDPDAPLKTPTSRKNAHPNSSSIKTPKRRLSTIDESIPSYLQERLDEEAEQRLHETPAVNTSIEEGTAGLSIQDRGADGADGTDNQTQKIHQTLFPAGNQSSLDEETVIVGIVANNFQPDETLPVSPTFIEAKSAHISPPQVDNIQCSLFLENKSAAVSRSVRLLKPDTIAPLPDEAGVSPILKNKKRKKDDVIKPRLNSEQTEAEYLQLNTHSTQGTEKPLDNKTPPSPCIQPQSLDSAHVRKDEFKQTPIEADESVKVVDPLRTQSSPTCLDFEDRVSPTVGNRAQKRRDNKRQKPAGNSPTSHEVKLSPPIKNETLPVTAAPLNPPPSSPTKTDPSSLSPATFHPSPSSPTTLLQSPSVTATLHPSASGPATLPASPLGPAELNASPLSSELVSPVATHSSRPPRRAKLMASYGRSKDESYRLTNVNLKPRQIQHLLDDPTSFLSSDHMNRIHELLRNFFKAKFKMRLGATFATELSDGIKQFPIADEAKWIQIIHDGKDHWLLAANGFCGSEKVVVYDSLNFQPELRQHFLMCLSSLVRSQEPTLHYTVADCQKQSENLINASDCGVFAAAFATSLVNGDDPSSLHYDVKKLRPFLVECFKKGKLEPFPSKPKKRSLIKKPLDLSIKVRCVCRRSFYQTDQPAWDMIECEKCLNWFHRMCTTRYPRNPREVEWFL